MAFGLKKKTCQIQATDVGAVYESESSFPASRKSGGSLCPSSKRFLWTPAWNLKESNAVRSPGVR